MLNNGLDIQYSIYVKGFTEHWIVPTKVAFYLYISSCSRKKMHMLFKH